MPFVNALELSFRATLLLVLNLNFTVSLVMSHLSKVQTLADELLKAWRVPAMSIALVKTTEGGDLTSETSHFGTHADGRAPADATLYNIGSVSKWVSDHCKAVSRTKIDVSRSFVAFVLAILVDEGKIAWDTRVQEVIPEFKVKVDKVSQEATIMDLLVCRRACTMLWKPDLVAYRLIDAELPNGKPFFY